MTDPLQTVGRLSHLIADNGADAFASMQQFVSALPDGGVRDEASSSLLLSALSLPQLRPDVSPPLSEPTAPAALENAPATREGYFVVPLISATGVGA